jgi:hypothetical protein
MSALISTYSNCESFQLLGAPSVVHLEVHLEGARLSLKLNCAQTRTDIYDSID